MLTSADISLLTNTFSFWPHLNNAQKETLLANTSLHHFHKEQILHYGSDDCLGVLMIKTGSLRICMLSDEGREVTLYRLEQDDICMLSASCMLKDITFDVYIETESDCDVLLIPTSIYSKITEENIYAENFSYKKITERFSDVMWAMQQLLFISMDKRLAAFLLDESLKTNSDTLYLTHEQIAKYLGSAREVISRMLKYFSMEGYVSLTRGGITLVDKKKMRELTSR